MLADSDAVVQAIIQVLAADATLQQLMPDGVWYDVAPNGLTRFVVVSQLHHEDAYLFDDASETFTIQVKAVELETSDVNARAAAIRIYALLQDAPLTIPGYALMNLKRQEHIGYTEPDPVNGTDWQHRGGQYKVMVQPQPSALEKE